MYLQDLAIPTSVLNQLIADPISHNGDQLYILSFVITK